MLLHANISGTGQRVAVLLHGLMGSHESWHRIEPLLVERGYRVVSIDLPGHGHSERDPHLTMAAAASSVVETVRSITPERPALALGHSYGGALLGLAAAELDPILAVHIDTALTIPGGADRDALTEQYEQDRRGRTTENLRRTRPYYSAEDADAEARAAELFDPATSASLSCGAAVSWHPRPEAIVVRAEPSIHVPPEDAAALQRSGVDVRSIPNAAHTVWYSHFHEFIAALPEVFGVTSGRNS